MEPHAAQEIRNLVSATIRECLRESNSPLANGATREQFPRRSRIRTGRTVPYVSEDAATERRSRFTSRSAVRHHPPAPSVQQDFDMHFCALPDHNSVRPTGRSETARNYFQRMKEKYQLGEATLSISREASVQQVHAMLITAFPGYEEVRDLKMFVGKDTSSGQLREIRIDNCPVIICTGEELWTLRHKAIYIRPITASVPPIVQATGILGVCARCGLRADLADLDIHITTCQQSQMDGLEQSPSSATASSLAPAPTYSGPCSGTRSAARSYASGTSAVSCGPSSSTSSLTRPSATSSGRSSALTGFPGPSSATSSLTRPSATSSGRSSATGPSTASAGPSSATSSSGLTSSASPAADIAVSIIHLLGHGPISEERSLQLIFDFVSRSRSEDMAFMIELDDGNEYQYFYRAALNSEFRYARFHDLLVYVTPDLYANPMKTKLIQVVTLSTHWLADDANYKAYRNFFGFITGLALVQTGILASYVPQELARNIPNDGFIKGLADYHLKELLQNQNLLNCFKDRPVSADLMVSSLERKIEEDRACDLLSQYSFGMLTSFLSNLGNETSLFYGDGTEVTLNDIVFWAFGASYPFIPAKLKLIVRFVTLESGLNAIPMVDAKELALPTVCEEFEISQAFIKAIEAERRMGNKSP